MNAKRVNAAMGVIHASQKTKQTAAGIAADLEAACLLQSPESAAELAGLRSQLESARVDGQRLARAEQRRAELEAVLRTHRDDDRAEIERLRARVAELEADLAPKPCGRELSTGQPCPDHPRSRPAENVTPQVRKLRGILARQREDAYQSPLHHDYALGHDLPETTP